MTKTIAQYQEYYRTEYQAEKEIKDILEYTLDKIKFLESIYITGGKNYHYSESFADSAHAERQELCKKSSALYDILRKDYNTNI